MLGNNMFAYCGNNPVQRKDVDGESWIAVLGAIGVQYASDVIGNIIDGKTGAEVFIPTSSLADYTAAAITALIPGGSIGDAFVRSVVSETILWVDNAITGKSELNDFATSCWNVVGNTFIDYGTGKFLENTFDQLGTEELATYSSSPKRRISGATLQQTYNSLQRSNTIGRAIGKLGTKICETVVVYCTQ